MVKQLSKKRTVFIIIAAMVGILLASLDSNVVGTAMPKIISSLKGFDLYTWPITAYLLTMAISMPLFGKMADLYGFKPVYLFGVSVFLLGSVLCSISQNMLEFIFFRGLQGIGGAILISNTMVIISLLFPPADRAKYGGLVSSASGLASLIGPFLGGMITDHANWRWVFLINIPLGLVVLLIIVLAFPGMDRRVQRKRIDFAGSAILIAALVPMLLAFTWGGKTYSWNSIQIVIMFVFSIVMLIVFGITENKVDDPIIPMSLFKNEIFNFTAAEMFLLNSILMVSIIFIPLFLQGVKGSSASSSGAIVTPMLVSLIIGVMITGFVVSKTCRYKIMAIVGFLTMGVSTLMLSFWNRQTGDIQTIIAMVVMGIGIGVVMAIFNVTAQSAFPDEQMGVVTSSVQFFGRMGQTLASSILGTVLSSSMTGGFQHIDISKFPPKLAGMLKDTNTLSSQTSLRSLEAQIPSALLPDFERLMVQVRQVLSDSIHQIFIICCVVVLVSLVIVFFMKEVPLSKTKNAD